MSRRHVPAQPTPEEEVAARVQAEREYEFREMQDTPGWKNAREALRAKRACLLEQLATCPPEKLGELQAECRILKGLIEHPDQFLIPRGSG